MGLWDSHCPPGEPGPLRDALAAIRAVLPEAFRAAREARLVTHCEHGTPRAERCCWCYVQTPAYRQSLADAMRTVLD